MHTTHSAINPAADPFAPLWRGTLDDGSRVAIRPIRRHDKDAERAFIDSLSHEAMQFRFLGQAHPSEQMLEHFSNVDPAREAALVAVVKEGEDERIVGVSRYSADPGSLDCEFAVVVADEFRHRDLGVQLMTRLIEVARARGLRTMRSIDHPENDEMRELARELGFRRQLDPEDTTQVIHELSLLDYQAVPDSAG